MKIREKIKKIFEFGKNRYEENEREITYQIAKGIVKNDNNATLLDVRSPQEYKEGHLEGAMNIPLYNLQMDCEKKIKNKEGVVIIYCQSGNRSNKAIHILEEKEYKRLYQLKGGLDEI